MRVLFLISILALIALLWASVAIARHVQQARRRHHRESPTEAATELKGRP
jgi:heme exporter protein D